MGKSIFTESLIVAILRISIKQELALPICAGDTASAGQHFINGKPGRRDGCQPTEAHLGIGRRELEVEENVCGAASDSPRPEGCGGKKYKPARRREMACHIIQK
ncbi:MAG: hypothetical protein KatS3mg031_3016 [Chitinophagales bacterium]|nr:MAG: hypothetical protein KatS3mg031_3016 [Chitinophagales bacterium]